MLVAVVACIALQANAQSKPAAKFKPPKLYTQLGSYRDSVTITVAEAEQLVGTTLKIFDDKKGVYSISSYQLAYRKIGVTEDEKTGKVTPTYTLTASLFKTTPLPQNWIQQLREQVKPGDELWFFDVIAKDAQGRVMYAPDLKFRIKN
ncbi:MAG: hypothetical protein EOP53_14625 [Sphingobacteriales bacterium]|nr:MAG: hypothetical protein EOP53_14625 [Sphingobacteriales bacterium]